MYFWSILYNHSLIGGYITLNFIMICNVVEKDELI